jgi:hypothetical protein
MIANSKVVELFDGTGPQEGSDYHVGGDYSGASEEEIVYFPGGSGPLREVSRMIQEAGPSGLAQAGGARRNCHTRRNRKHQTRKHRNRKHRKTQRRRRNNRN